MLTKDNKNTLPFKGRDGVGMGPSGTTLLALFLLFAIFITSKAVLAGSPDPETVTKTYTKAEKTCKQMQRNHEKMKGEHNLMFKAWQEKSSPLLTEDEEVLTECKTTLSALKDIAEQLGKIVADDPLKETLFNDYDKRQSIMEDVTGRHKTLREKHERLFHEMMGH